MFGPEKNFQNEGSLRWLENAIMRLAFANTVSHKRVVLLSFELEYTESLLDIL